MARRGSGYVSITTASRRLGKSASRVVQLFDAGILRGIRDDTGRRLISEKSLERELVRRRETGAGPAEITR